MLSFCCDALRSVGFASNDTDSASFIVAMCIVGIVACACCASCIASAVKEIQQVRRYETTRRAVAREGCFWQNDSSSVTSVLFVAALLVFFLVNLQHRGLL